MPPLASSTTYTPYSPTANTYAAYAQMMNPAVKIGQTGQIIASPTQRFTSPSAPAFASPGAVPSAPGAGSFAPSTGSGGFNINPSPQGGAGAYGAVPGPTAAPPSIYEETSKVFPGLSSATGKVSQNVINELNGVLSPETLQNIQQHAAQLGIQTGMPGSDFGKYGQLRSIGLTTEGVQGQGLKDYLSALQGIGSTQLSPQLLAELSMNNAMLAAAPNPAAAAFQMQQDFLKQANKPMGGGFLAPAPSPYNLNPNQNTYREPSYGEVVAPSTGTGSYYDGQYLEQAPKSIWDQVRTQPYATYSPPGYGGGGSSILNESDYMAGTGGYQDPYTGVYYDDSGQILNAAQ